MKKTITIFIMLLSTSICFSQTNLTDDNAKSKMYVNNDRLIVVEFHATWAGPCRYMRPIINELGKKYGSKVDFYRIDVDKNNVDNTMGISTLPTYLFIKNSSILEEVKGARKKESMENLIKKHMNNNTE